MRKNESFFFNEKKIFIPNQIVAFEAWNNSQNYKDSFEPFSRDLNGQIMKEYNMKMSQEDLSLFFEKLHRHYTNYLK